MVKRGILRAALLLGVSFWNGAETADAARPALVQYVRNSTVMVHVEYGDDRTVRGSGIVIGPGLVVTNAHVVNENAPKRVYVSNDILPRTPARVLTLRYDDNQYNADRPHQKNYDIAVLSFTPEGGAPLPPALPFARQAVPSEPVVVAGYPGDALRRSERLARPHRARARRAVQPGGAYGGAGGMPAFSSPMVVTTGEVMSLSAGEPGLVIHDAYCGPGNSGGPVVNSRGEILGMQTWTTLPGSPDEYMAIAISARDIAGYLELNGFRLLR